MCALRAAQFLLQKGSFSCRDAHAFNRNSSSQVTMCVGCSRFNLVSVGFSAPSSFLIPSFHRSPVLVLFRFVADNSSGAFRLEFSGAPRHCALDREARLSRGGSCAGSRLCERARPPWSRTSVPANRNHRSNEREHVFLQRTGPNI